MKSCTIFFVIWMSLITYGQERSRWQLTDNNAITWTIEGSQLPHSDDIEMSGRKISGIVSYTVNEDGQLSLERQLIYPQLHPYIKETDPWWKAYRAYVNKTYTDEILPKFYIGDKEFVPGKLKQVIIDGIITFEHEASSLGLTLSRKLFPSTDKSLFMETWIITNTTDSELIILPAASIQLTTEKGKDGNFTIGMLTAAFKDEELSIELKPDESFEFSHDFIGIHEEKSPINLDEVYPKLEIEKRQAFLREMSSNLILETPDPVLNQLFAFSKIRASESIFDSKLGAIHSPGGGRYYVGIWANDQAEYVSPFFPYLGYDLGNESALNTYKAFDSVKSPIYEKIQYAFEVEELKPPSALDRGDAAMIAYGASQYALARGDREEAEKIWPLIEWCLEYNHRQLNKDGVVRSESDEMEGRIETGDANLSTSSLYYGGLQNAIYLGSALGKNRSMLNVYTKRLKDLDTAIESYFGARVEGLDTYKYYAAHEYLRHWICLPLVMDINKRNEATVEALFERLWTDNGVHVEKNSDDEDISKIFWDRGTLYALRGTFRTGATEKSLERLQQFSTKRLLGERVPYVVEAFPEGNMAHLSAESGLYCRVFTEGVFAITPTSFNSFSMQPRLPDSWDTMALRHIRLFDKDFDIEVQREDEKTRIRIIDHIKGGKVLDKIYDLDKPIHFSF